MLDRAALKILHGDEPAGADPMADSRAAAAPPRALGIWILVVVGLLGAGGGLSWWTLVREEAVPVEITRVQKAAGPAPSVRSQTLNASGYVVARRMATVSANVTGKIAELYVEEGDSVTEGQPLARLDGTINQAKVDLEEGRLQLARAKLQEVEARLAQRSRELKRLQVLAAKKLTSESSYDAILGEVQALDAGLTAAKMEIEVGQRQLDLSRRELEELVIRAPFAGVVVSQTAQRGEVVSPISAADSYTRTGISTVVDMSSLELEVDVNESYIDRVSPKQATMAVLEAYPDWRIPGQVINTVPTVNRQKGTVKVRVAISEKPPGVLPNMGVQVEFLSPSAPAEGSQRQTAAARITVPTAAVVREGEGSFVFVVENGRTRKQSVQVGHALADGTEILAGLTGGEALVLSPDARLVDGVAVREKRSAGQ